jgi:hypothetical protein
MPLELKSYIVAFIDLLGFSSMVSHDCEKPNGEQKYIESLYNCHIETKKLRENHPDLQLVQFSDSVVFALPYSIDNYINIIRMISDYQYSLLKKEILCRGGVSYGKHFFAEDFLFSNGLIEAYRLESQTAKSPRIVVSEDLLELVRPMVSDQKIILPLLFEQDGLCFIDYLCGKKPSETWSAIKEIIPNKLSSSSSIRSKQIWLIDFYNHTFPQQAHVVHEKFSATMP